MSRQIHELEDVLRQLIDQHRTLLAEVEAQQQALRAGKSDAIEQSSRQQEATRRRIAGLETRRRNIAVQIGRAMRMADEPTVSMLIRLFPTRSDELTKLRDELRSAMQDVAKRTQITTRLTSAVLGHLNFAVRLIAGAVEQAGVYTKSGSPQISARIGVMEAVG